MYLIIGSDGYLGQKFCKYLDDEEKDYVKIGRRTSNDSNYVSIGNNIDKLDSILSEKFKDIEITKIIYLATYKKEGLFLQISDEDITDHLYVNYILFIKILRYFVKKMVPNKNGNVLYVGSSKAHTGDIGTSLYSSSKAASVNIIKSLSKEYGRFNLCFNSLMLGYFGGKLWDQIPEKIKEKMLKEPNLNRLGNTDEFCSTAYFLLNSTYMTGQEIYLDGGLE